MVKGPQKKYSKHKAKLFLFFLAVAGVFWILTKFSREFTTSMSAKIDYINLPETAALASDNKHELSFDLTANGFEILFYKLKKPALTVDVSKYYDPEERSFTITKPELLRRISSHFNKYMEIRNLSSDELNVRLDPIILKKVPVIPKLDISYKKGFKPVDSIKLFPDSVVVSGPQGTLENIKFVNTELLSLQNVEKNISAKVGIVAPSEDIEKINPSKIEVEYKVAEFSQGKFTLPVEIVNLPPNVELKLVPERVTVSFDMAVELFPNVSRNNFRLICDYSKRNQKENFMLPKLAKMPEGAVNIDFEPKKVDYFIFK